jgi:deoxyribodipyrimidine photo-lyase
LVHTPETAKSIIDRNTVLFWHRRDLRFDDNAGLYFALKENTCVLPVFIFDSVILDKLEDKRDRRVEFILESLLFLKQYLEAHSSSLLIVYGDPVVFFASVDPAAVYTNHDYEPYARKRDEDVKDILAKKNIRFHTFKDQVIFDTNEITKDDSKPYTVFTPYSKKWKIRVNDFYSTSYQTTRCVKNLKRITPLAAPELADIGFRGTGSKFPERAIKLDVILKYHNSRNYPALKGTSRLGVHLRFGTVSIRKVVRIALEKNDTWLNELIWRDFYHMILWHFPDVDKSFKRAYDRIKWRNIEDEFNAWCAGMTGYPIVDAGMRELNETGFMHNRVRMIVASFLCKHLLIDWRWGEAYFASKLLDFDLASNNGGWQWAAGSGCDAAPYFRIFNPQLQTEKFDPALTYIKKWVPEFNTSDYPKPIVDHKFARERALRTYKEMLFPALAK